MSDIVPMSDEMVSRFREGMARAGEAGLPEPTAMTLATVDARGCPSARTVLLKDMDAEGFVFYTNLGSRKGRHLAGCAEVALLFWWRETAEQVQIEGVAEQVDDETADAYFATRPRGSQIGAWASKQSEVLESRQALIERVKHFERKFEGRDVPRPPHWSGYLVRPRLVEFWYGRNHRLHDRFRYRAGSDGWQLDRLYP